MDDTDTFDRQEQRARMLAKLEIVWNSNPHLTFLQLTGYMSQYPASAIIPATVDDRCEAKIDEALQRSFDETTDIFGHYRPGKAPPIPAPVISDMDPTRWRLAPVLQLPFAAYGLGVPQVPVFEQQDLVIPIHLLGAVNDRR